MAPSRRVRTRLDTASVLQVVARVVAVLLFCLVAAWWAYGMWWESYVLGSPHTPRVSTGQTVAMTYKGATYFVEPRWLNLDRLLNPGVGVLAIGLIVAGALIDRAAKRARHAGNKTTDGGGNPYLVCPECLGQGSGNMRNICTYCLGTGFADGKVKS